MNQQRTHRSLLIPSLFIYSDPPTIGRLARTPLRDMPAVDPLRTMDGAIRAFVRSSKLRQFLGRFATYVGTSPFLAPATLNVIAHVELSGGVWYPQGGVYSIAAVYRWSRCRARWRLACCYKTFTLISKTLQI